MAKKVKAKARLKFFEYEVALSFFGAAILTIGIISVNFFLQKPNLLFLLLAIIILWGGLFVFVWPLIRKIEGLMG